MADKRPADQQASPLLAAAPEEMHPIIAFLNANMKLIALGVGGLLLAVAVASGYRAWSESRLAESREELAKLVAAQGEDRLANLKAFAEDAPSAVRPAALYELARVADEEEDRGMALEAFRKMRDNAEGELRAVAELGVARTLLAMGEPGQALQELKAAPAVPEAYKTILTRTRAQAAEMAGQWSEALAAYGELRELEPGNEEFIAAKLSQIQARQGQAGQTGQAAPAAPAS